MQIISKNSEISFSGLPMVQALKLQEPLPRNPEERRAYDNAYWEQCRVGPGKDATYRPRKTGNIPWGANKLPDFARFRMAVRFDNQKYAYYPSYDYNFQMQDGKQTQIYCEQTGLEKLYTLANKEKKYWNWVAISIFVNITDKWANAQEKKYNYRLITWERNKTSKLLLQLQYTNGRVDLDWVQMWVAQNNAKGYSTAEERAPWEVSQAKYSKTK